MYSLRSSKQSHKSGEDEVPNALPMTSQESMVIEEGGLDVQAVEEVVTTVVDLSAVPSPLNELYTDSAGKSKTESSTEVTGESNASIEGESNSQEKDGSERDDKDVGKSGSGDFHGVHRPVIKYYINSLSKKLTETFEQVKETDVESSLVNKGAQASDESHGSHDVANTTSDLMEEEQGCEGPSGSTEESPEQSGEKELVMNEISGIGSITTELTAHSSSQYVFHTVY